MSLTLLSDTAVKVAMQQNYRVDFSTLNRGHVTGSYVRHVKLCCKDDCDTCRRFVADCPAAVTNIRNPHLSLEKILEYSTSYQMYTKHCQVCQNALCPVCLAGGR